MCFFFSSSFVRLPNSLDWIKKPRISFDRYQDTIRNPSVMDFIDRTLEEAPFSSRHVLNFLHSGPPEDRQPDMPDFDWRDVFNLTDRVIRMLNQYGDVSFFAPPRSH